MLLLLLLLVCVCLPAPESEKGDRPRLPQGRRSEIQDGWLVVVEGGHWACLDSCLGKAETWIGLDEIFPVFVCLAPSRTDRSRQVRVSYGESLSADPKAVADGAQRR